MGRRVRVVCVYSLLSLGPGLLASPDNPAPWEMLGQRLAPDDPPPLRDLCSRQTVPDFQETRPRNYILSASASAVSAPPRPPGLSLPWHQGTAWHQEHRAHPPSQEGTSPAPGRLPVPCA